MPTPTAPHAHITSTTRHPCPRGAREQRFQLEVDFLTLVVCRVRLGVFRVRLSVAPAVVLSLK